MNMALPTLESAPSIQSSIQSTQAPHQPTVSIIIPARNEAANLPYVLPRIPALVSEVILVDGGSVDDTCAIAKRLLPSIKIVHQTGQGKGDALQCGFAAATGDIIVMLDADGSADPVEISRFIAPLLAGADFAKGTRFAAGGGSDDITQLRRLGNWGLTGIVNLLFGTRFTDLCYGYNAFWRDCLQVMAVDCPGFEVETLINLRISKAKRVIAEVPSYESSRIHGVSNLNAARDGWRVLKTILVERTRRPETTVGVLSEPLRRMDIEDVPTILLSALVAPRADYPGAPAHGSAETGQRRAQRRHGHDAMAVEALAVDEMAVAPWKR